MEDGRRRKVHVRGVPQVANGLPEHPALIELDAEVERHDNHRDEDIRERERHDEVVCDDSEFSGTIRRGSDIQSH